MLLAELNGTLEIDTWKFPFSWLNINYHILGTPGKNFKAPARWKQNIDMSKHYCKQQKRYFSYRCIDSISIPNNAYARRIRNLQAGHKLTKSFNPLPLCSHQVTVAIPPAKMMKTTTTMIEMRMNRVWGQQRQRRERIFDKCRDQRPWWIDVHPHHHNKGPDGRNSDLPAVLLLSRVVCQWWQHLQN